MVVYSKSIAYLTKFFTSSPRTRKLKVPARKLLKILSDTPYNMTHILGTGHHYRYFSGLKWRSVVTLLMAQWVDMETENHALSACLTTLLEAGP